MTLLGGARTRYAGAAFPRHQVTWSDGTPSASATTPAGIATQGLNNGFRLTLPADTTPRTLVIYLGAYKGVGVLTASLSDGSASPYTSPNSGDGTSILDRRVELTYAAASAGQSLIVEYRLQSGTEVSLQAATLASGGNGGPQQFRFIHLSDSHLAEAGAPITMTTLPPVAYRYAGTSYPRHQVTWSDGALVSGNTSDQARSATTPSGLALTGAGNRFTLTLPADPMERKAKIYLGAYKNVGALTASLSDGSASPYTSPPPRQNTCRLDRTRLFLTSVS